MGRNTTYTPDIALLICERLVEGESLRAICRSEGMPPLGTVFRWLEAQEAFRDQYTRAREIQAESFADELTEIADDGSNDWMVRRNRDGEMVGWQENGEAIGRSRLRVDTRKWIVSKILPKKYGEKTEHTINGPVTLQLEGSDVNG